MAAVVIKAASKLGGVIGGGGDPVQTAVSVSDAAAHIMDTVREQQAKEAARNNDNEFNIRKNFLDNAVAAIQDATYSQFNTVICTDQAHDDFQNLTGQILRMDLIDVEVAQGKVVNFQVYVFDTGKYLRHGKWERDHWWCQKLDAAAIKQKQDQEAKEAGTAAAASAAVKASQAQTSATNAQGLQIDAGSQPLMGLTDHLVRAAAGPGLQMLAGGLMGGLVTGN